MSELATAILGESEHAVFENLYVAYAGEARGVARAILGDAQLAADAVHNGFIEMLRYVAGGRRWHDPDDARAMVLRNVRWAALKLRRTRNRLDLGLDIAPSSTGDEAEWARTEARALCEQIVAGLSRNHQAVLHLRFVDGLSHADAARRLGVSVGVFESRLQRAVAAARRAARTTGLLPRLAGLAVASTSAKMRSSRTALRPLVAGMARGVCTVAVMCGVVQSVAIWNAGGEMRAPVNAASHVVSVTPVSMAWESIDDADVVDAVLLPSRSVVAVARGQRCQCLLLFRSDDGGATWGSAPRTEAATRRGTVLATALHAQPCGSVAAAAFCASGAATADRRAGTLLAVSPTRFLYFRPSGGVLCSPDAGLTWGPRCTQDGVQP